MMENQNNLYLTPSLINSWLYLINNPEVSNEDDFWKILNKVSTIQSDIKYFKNRCFNRLVPQFNEIVGHFYIYQISFFKKYKNITIVSKVDVVGIDTIYKIKCSYGYSNNLGKYLRENCDHILQTYCSGIKNFKYLIWDESIRYSEKERGDFITEDYIYQKNEAEALIDEFLQWLKDVNYKKLWQEKWRIKQNG